jgi:hypothetical protein
MKHLPLALALFFTGISHAQTPSRDVNWSEICQYADGRPMEVTTATGDKVTGYCASVTDTELGIRSPKGIVKIARTGLAKLQVDRSRESPTQELHRKFHKAMRHSVRNVFSPRAIAGLVEVPIVTAWGATALPFCLMGEIGHERGSIEVRPI